MKYGKLTLGQIEALINKMGGYEEMMKFLRGETELIPKKVPLKMLRKSIYLRFHKRSNISGLHVSTYGIHAIASSEVCNMFYEKVQDVFEEIRGDDFLSLKVAIPLFSEDTKHISISQKLATYHVTKEYVEPTRIAQEIIFLIRKKIYIRNAHFVWRFKNIQNDYVVTFELENKQFNCFLYSDVINIIHNKENTICSPDFFK